MINRDSFKVTTLGEPRFESPLRLSDTPGDGIANYVDDETRVLYQVCAGPRDFDPDIWMDRAGPRRKLFFDPKKTRAAITTCGGLSPGLNNVIRSVFLELHYRYRVSEVWGFRYGYRGINQAHGNVPIRMTPGFVRTIHHEGGSVLGSSRGAEKSSVIVDQLVEMGIDILFCVGGDGTLRGAHDIALEVAKRNHPIAVVGIPKTIDNDIPFVYKTFGFDTAVEVIRQAIDGAHVEAVGAPNGIGLVKVMGRDSGFLAAYGSLASMEVNFCLIPELPFKLRGQGGFLERLQDRLVRRGHVVVVVAEGAGQDLFDQQSGETDLSGNKRYNNIGLLLKDEIGAYLKERSIPHNLKYIDPSYMIRSGKANASDAIFCDNLARNAVHAGMAGATDVVIGLWHGTYVHLPIGLVTKKRKSIHPESFLWRNVVGATGQPRRMDGSDF